MRPSDDDRPDLTAPAALAAVVLAGIVLAAGRETMAWGPLMRVLLPGLWLAVWSAASIGIGRPVVTRCLCRDDPLRTSLLVAAALGAALLSLAATMLATVGLLRPAVVAGVLIAAAVAGGAVLIRGRGSTHAVGRAGTSESALVLALPLLCGFAVLLLLTTPPVMYDVANYHLAFPQRWLEAGSFVEFPRHAFSYYPSAHGMCSVYALATVGPWGASALHAWFGGLAAVAVWSLSRRLAGPRAAAWAVACFVLTPAALEVSGYASADLVIAGWGAVALTLVADPRAGRRRALLAGVLVGSAVAAKILAAATVALPVAVALIVAAGGRGGRRRAVSATAWMAAVAAVVVLPWWLRNLAWTGNPMYPYLGSIFGGDDSGLSIAGELRQNGAPWSGLGSWLASTLTAGVERTFRPLGQGGWIGLHWLILLPTAAIARVRRSPTRSAIWAACVVGLIGWGALVQFGRFLLPVLAFAAPMAGAAAASLTTGGSRVRQVGVTALLGLLLAANATVLGTTLNLDRLAVTAGRLTDARFMARWLDYAPLIDAIEQDVPPTGTILLVAEARSLYIPRPVIVEDPYRVPLLVELASRAGDTSELAAAVTDLGVTHLLINRGDMDRHAGLRGVSGYFTGAGPRERAMLDGFLSDRMSIVAEVGAIQLARITAPTSGTPAVGTPGT